jgi:hypothetical protein
MRNPNLALQNLAGEKQRPASSASVRFRETERMLSPFEVDALLASSGLFGSRERRVLTDFRDNHSGDFHLFRIY